MERRKTDPISQDIWTGRKTDPAMGPLYYYQRVNKIDSLNEVKRGDWVITGYPYDKGIDLNQGRIGANEGPNAIRKAMAGIACHHKRLSLCDYGNLILDGLDVEGAQRALSEATLEIIKRKGIPINLGGGHDMSAGTGYGVHEALLEKKIGIINFDAHFDLRQHEKTGANSGTPFYQLIQAFPKSKYLVLGLENTSNTMDLFDTADKYHAQYCTSESMQLKPATCLTILDAFLSDCDHIHLSIDMDVFSAAYAPGVSASNPFGLSPIEINPYISLILQSGKISAIDIAELSPRYDRDHITAKLASRLLAKIVNSNKPLL